MRNVAVIETGKLEALNRALENMDKAFGKGVVVRLGGSAKLKVETIPSGSTGLDIALGVGGFSKGRITEIYGPESSGSATRC